ncbi:MAG: ABC transporter ATP-binding protein [Burkholderiaceae bacterium]
MKQLSADVTDVTVVSALRAQAAVELPQRWRTLAPLPGGQDVLAFAETDLDDRLHFVRGIVVLTHDHLFARSEGDTDWTAWPITDELRLVSRDHAGVGHLELLSPSARLARWHYTLGAQPAVTRLVESFECSSAGGPRDARSGSSVASGATRPSASSDDSDDDADDDGPEAESPSTRSLLRLWRFARPYRGRLVLGFVLTLLATGATLVPPYMTMPLMDDILIPHQNGAPLDTGRVVLYLGGLLAAALLAWVLGWARTYVLALVSERIGADLRTATFEHLLRLSLSYFGGKRTGDLMARIGSETDRLNLFLSLQLLDFATDLLLISMTALILFTIDPWLALATLVPLPFIAWMIHVVRDRLRYGFEKADRIWGEVTNVLADTIPGIRVVKAFAQEQRETARFRAANQHNVAVNDHVNRLWAMFSPTVALLTEIGLLVVWAVGIWMVAHDQVTVGVLTAFLTYIGRFYTRLDSMSRIVSHTQRAASAAKRIFDILDHVSNVPEPVRPVHLSEVAGRIELRGVGFRYGSRQVLRSVDLAIQPGEMIGLVGHSGSGKSTLVNLICRFYDVADGEILVDGVDVRSLPIAEYRRHVGVVLQEPFLFFGSIAENIAYGRPDASRAEIVAAARAANAHEFILRLPQGYDSLVGERGQTLSGGERQRISIARALLIDPKVLILDEATSSVDTTTEKLIQKALDNLVQGRTTIAIAHRLSTLRRASRLVVLDGGEIVEVGPHDELMARKGAYYRLYQAQLRQADAGDEAGGDVSDSPAADVGETGIDETGIDESGVVVAGNRAAGGRAHPA